MVYVVTQRVVFKHPSLESMELDVGYIQLKREL